MKGTWKSTAVGTIALSLGLAGCVAMPSARQGGMDRLDTLVKGSEAQQRSKLTISVKDNSPEAKLAAAEHAQAAKGGYKVNYVRVNDWDTMRVTLAKLDNSNFTGSTAGTGTVADPYTLATNSTVSFNTADAARSATATLTGLAPENGFKLTVELIKTTTNSTDGTTQTVIARGTNDGTGAGFNLSSGTNTIVVALGYVIDNTGAKAGGQITVNVSQPGAATAVSTSVTTQSSFNIARVAGRKDNTASYAGVTGANAPTSALTTYMNQLGGLVIDKFGKLIVSDRARNQVLRLETNGSATAPVIVAGATAGTAGNAGDGGLASAATMSAPSGIAYIPSSDTLYVADYANNRVRKITSVTDAAAATINNFLGGGTTAPGAVNTTRAAADTTISNPMAVAVDPSGNVYIAEYGANRVLRYNIADNTLKTIATGVTNPQCLAYDNTNNILFVGNRGGALYKITSLTGTATTALVHQFPGTTLKELRSIAYDQNGLIYAGTSDHHNVTDGRYNNKLWRLAVKTAGTTAGSVETGRTSELLAGTDVDSINQYSNHFVDATATPVANALNQYVLTPGYSSLFIDTYDYGSTTTLGGVLYAGLNYYSGGYGHVVKLSPNAL